MKKLIYGIFAEDDANKIFIRNTIPQLIQYLGLETQIELTEELEYSETMTPTNGEYVEEHCVRYIAVGVKRFDLDICFIGLDSDDEKHAILFGRMSDEITQAGLEKHALISIPVQAAEYWLWYIKVKKEEPTLHETSIIDRTNKRGELKEWIYSRKRVNNKRSNPIVEKLSKDYDINWLIQHSQSFEHFVNHFKAFFTIFLATSDEEE